MFYQIAIRAVNLLWHFWFKLQIYGREIEPKQGGYMMAFWMALMSPAPRETGKAFSQRMTCFKTGTSNSSALAM